MSAGDPGSGTTQTATAAPSGVAVPVRRRASRSLRWLQRAVAVLLYMPLLAIPLRDSPLAFMDRCIAGLTWILCLLPTLAYLRKPRTQRPPIPFLPIIGLAYGLYFALQAVVGGTNLYVRFDMSIAYPVLEPQLYARPIRLALYGWAMLLVGYWLVPPARRSRHARDPDLSLRRVRRLVPAAFVVLVGGSILGIASHTIGMPGSLRGLLVFFFSLSLLALAMLSMLAARRQLSRAARAGFVLCVASMVFVQAGSSATASMFMTLIAVSLGIWIALGTVRPRWVCIGLSAALLFVTMRGVVLDHRRALAKDQAMSGAERSLLLVALIGERVSQEGPVSSIVSGWEAVSARAALLDLFTDVARQTPDPVPYWGGATYASLVGAFVPRFLWPDKPKKTLGFDFGHRYGYLARDDYSTTINLPFLIEFYANFGEMGVVVGMLLVGALYKLLERLMNRPNQDVLISIAGLGVLLPLINIESDFSLIFGGVFLNGAALWLLLRVADSYAGGRRLLTGGSPARRLLGSGLGGERLERPQVP